MGVRAFGNRVVAVEPPGADESRVILPVGVDRGDPTRAVVVSSLMRGERINPVWTVEVGDVVHFWEAEKIGSEFVVHIENIIAIERREEET